MNKSVFISKFIKKTTKSNKIVLSEEEFALLDEATINEIINNSLGNLLVRLPEREIRFFEWLKINDPKVWDDLWSNASEEDSEKNSDDDLYYVSVKLLPVVVNKDGRGLPICDLQTTDNYFFSIDNMVDEESKIIIEVAEELCRQNKPLTIPQLLAFEISFEPIDIWHFAYKHKIELGVAKNAVEQLVNDGALVHLKEYEYLIPFIHF